MNAFIEDFKRYYNSFGCEIKIVLQLLSDEDAEVVFDRTFNLFEVLMYISENIDVWLNEIKRESSKTSFELEELEELEELKELEESVELEELENLEEPEETSKESREIPLSCKLNWL